MLIQYRIVERYGRKDCLPANDTGEAVLKLCRILTRNPTLKSFPQLVLKEFKAIGIDSEQVL